MIVQSMVTVILSMLCGRKMFNFLVIFCHLNITFFLYFRSGLEDHLFLEWVKAAQYICSVSNHRTHLTKHDLYRLFSIKMLKVNNCYVVSLRNLLSAGGALHSLIVHRNRLLFSSYSSIIL